MDPFCRMSNSSVSEYKEIYTSDFNDFHQSNSRIKAKKRKWNQSIYDINCYPEAPTKKVVSTELCFQQRQAETTTLSSFELDLSTLCPGYSTNETIHSKVGSNKNSSLNEQRPEGVLSLLGPLFTSGSEYPAKETFRKIIPPLSYSNECSIEETLALPELGMSPKSNYKTDLNLFNSDSTCSLNSKQHAKATLSCLNQVFSLTSNKLNREKYVDIDDPMDMTNYIEDEENFCF